MMGVFLSYMLLGISLAAPIGPVNAAQLNKGVKHGFFHAWIFGIGALLADVTYMMLVYFGVINFLDTSFMKAFLWLFGFFVLTYSGIEGLLGIGKFETSMRNEKKATFFKSLSSGFAMSISNPLTILFWLGIYGSVLAQTASVENTGQLVFYSAAIILGILTWDVTMAMIAGGARRLLASNVLTGITIVSSISMIAFGIYFAVQASILLFS
ncbi:threonine/homoserine/homoserine lactone efflux protein [Bacillus capparidis]|nr:threonine/homoserine/homoserine lactone efflux protein [Bacillus capparidis]